MKNKILTYISFTLIMIALGASDAMRGIFATTFESHFSLTAAEISMIITVSYIGNLIFLLYGGYFADRYKHKIVSILVMGLWVTAILIYLFTDNYYCLLVGMFFSMGASTLMNTMINIMTPLIFIGAPTMIINTLFFTQGIGTTGSQKIAGKYAQNFISWKITNMIILIIGIIGIVLFGFINIPHKLEKNKKNINSTNSKGNFLDVSRNTSFIYLVFILGFYFVAEHGVLNWFVAYGNKVWGLPVSQASSYLAIFFGGITLGRLIFAPLVHKIGIHNSISFFGGIACISYIIGIIAGKNAILLFSMTGLFLSILYPTLIMMIQKYYHKNIIATATGMIISAATIFDIVFNAVFGKIIDWIGFDRGFLILPVCMFCFYIVYSVFRIRIRSTLEQ